MEYTLLVKGLMLATNGQLEFGNFLSDRILLYFFSRIFIAMMVLFNTISYNKILILADRLLERSISLSNQTLGNLFTDYLFV